LQSEPLAFAADGRLSEIADVDFIQFRSLDELCAGGYWCNPERITSY